MSNAAEDMTGTDNADAEAVLVVISKVKDYIKAASGMNTSGGVAKALSGIIRKKLDEAVERARQDGRKTVMDRDIQF